ncbi:MAG: hypothetical protein AB1813_28280 [Verrucomicrobiota bacterium]|jgi:CheY-like chemotaxis protein
MTEPLAIIFYENLLPGSQLVNRLQDLGYRVQGVPEVAAILPLAEKEKPLVILTDLNTHKGDICSVIASLKRNTATSHIPVLAFAGKNQKKLHSTAMKAGASLVAQEEAILTQLPQLLDQVLQLE